jgi:hypothetical protein
VLKPGRLTVEQYDVVKTHATLGVQIHVDALDGADGNGSFAPANR